MSSKHTFWESHVAAWLASGQTQSGYCREQGLSLASFGYWRHKLRGEAPTPSVTIVVRSSNLASRGGWRPDRDPIQRRTQRANRQENDAAEQPDGGRHISRETGISAPTLYTWKKTFRAQRFVVPSKPSKADDWDAKAKLAAVIQTASMNEIERSTYCREHGLYVEQLDAWKQAFDPTLRVNI